MGRGSSFVVAALVLALPVPASAAPEPDVLATDLLSPLSQAVAEDGTIWFSQNYAGLLQRMTPGQAPETVVDAPGDLEIAAVSESGGTLWYSVTGGGHTVGALHQRDADGTDTELVDLYAHEQQANPDRAFRYGFRELPAGCRPTGKLVRHRGVAQTHPVASVRAFGATYVADAAANAVTSVAGVDTATTVTAFPPVRTSVTAEFAEENGFPACTVGLDYWAEAVPTDVEAGPYGSLYVTTFPGGPSRADGRPVGALWRVLPLTGQAEPVATGLDTPVGIAVDPGSGDVYVSELQANRVVRIAAGTSEPTPYAELVFPGDLEWSPDGLVVGVDVLSGTSGVDPARGEIAVLN